MRLAETLAQVSVAVDAVEKWASELRQRIPLVPTLSTKTFASYAADVRALLDAYEDALMQVDSILDTKIFTESQITMVQVLVEKLQRTFGHLQLCQFTLRSVLDERVHRMRGMFP
ncbi:MAG: hypothetical protein ACI8RZ_003772 [Myxococcota bacterium]|jgi:hypothetical protein